MTADKQLRGSDTSVRLTDPTPPDWRLPEGLNTAVAIISFLTGAIGLFISDVADAPIAVKITMWLLIGAPIAALVWWAATHLMGEVNVVAYRYKTFGNALDEMQRLSAQDERQTQEIQRLNLLMAAIQLEPRSVEIVDYIIVDALLRSGNVFVTLNDDAQSLLVPGSILSVVDREDGMPLGTLEVTEERSGTGRCIAAFLTWDALFVTGLRDAAERREPVRTRSVARFTRDKSIRNDKTLRKETPPNVINPK